MKSKAGMTTVILNWKEGENDPFTVMNAAIAQHFRARGKNVAMVQITDSDWGVQLVDLSMGGIDFVFTWQGVGSGATIDNSQGTQSFWELLKVPLICIHGDHPAHCPPNHLLESRYCFHLYADPELARYSNRHFRRIRSAGVVDTPKLHFEPRLKWPTDDCFVMAKNISDPVETEKTWQQTLEKWLFEAHMNTAETLKQRIAHEAYVDVHGVIDDLIDAGADGMEQLSADIAPSAFHQFHSNLDFYVRNHKSVTALTRLREFPVRIYGRGWDRIAQNSPASHTFHVGLDMADSQKLFYSRFGLVDISPYQLLHDRTYRAMANGCSFLSSAHLEDTFSDTDHFDPLFFSFLRQDLSEKCAAVVSDPEEHRNRAQQFAREYFAQYNYKAFVEKLDMLARSIDRF
jgi:hypothetical protein